ncbi:hypothetical protein [Streptomyces guryensis]|uniref:hypothetical protein n=1 Tax=Streptomyces guryensis TaxID=2886947 RepID=UPI003FD88B37
MTGNHRALVRRDITEGKARVPLTLRLTVVDATDGGTPVSGAAVKIRHCDAWGYCSGYTTADPGGSAPAESEDCSWTPYGSAAHGPRDRDPSGPLRHLRVRPFCVWSPPGVRVSWRALFRDLLPAGTRVRPVRRGSSGPPWHRACSPPGVRVAGRARCSWTPRRSALAHSPVTGDPQALSSTFPRTSNASGYARSRGVP